MKHEHVDIIELMKERIGDNPVVNVNRYEECAQYYDREELIEAIDELDKLNLRIAVFGGKPNPLEKLAIRLIVRGTGLSKKLNGNFTENDDGVSKY